MVGISLSRNYALPMEEVIPLVKAAGFSAVSPLWGTKVDMAAVCRQARSLGLFVQSLHAPFGKADTLWSHDPAVFKEGIHAVMPALEDCIRLQIPVMVMHAWIDKDLSFDMDHLYFGNFDAIVEKAAAHNVKIAFENTEGEEYLFALLEHYKNNPHVGFCWDSGHEKCYNHDQDLLALFGDRLLVTHLNDNLGISDPQGEINWLDDLHLLPYDGMIDWEYNMQRLNRCRPLPYLNCELLRTSKPGRTENDQYANMPLDEYFKLAYARAKRLAEGYAL